MKNNQCGQHEGRNYPSFMFGSRGDLPLNHGKRGDPPELSGSRGHPYEIEISRDISSAKYVSRSNPPELRYLKIEALADPIHELPSPKGRKSGMFGREIRIKLLLGPPSSKRFEGTVSPSAVIYPDVGLTEKKYKFENHFSHLFNSYAQAFKKGFVRTGSLVQHPLKQRLEI